MLSEPRSGSVQGLRPVILCPTARFAARTMGQLAAQSQSAAWLTPEVYSFSAWLEALAHEYFLVSDDSRLLINTVQSEYIWQSLVDDDVFVGQPSVARLAMDAWRRLHEYCLVMPANWAASQCSEDASAFVSWSRRYIETCDARQWLDEWVLAAQLPHLISEGAIALPEGITCVGFELPRTPLQQRILQSCSDAGVHVEGLQWNENLASECKLTSIVSCLDPDSEIRAAARWARGEFEARSAVGLGSLMHSDANNTDQMVLNEVDAKRTSNAIAVVVPDLAGRLDSVERIFREEFDAPGFGLAPTAASPWHVSLGRPLGQWPLVADALDLLRLRPGRMPVELVTQLLRSPFLAGFDTEALERAATLNALHDRAPYLITAQELVREAESHNAHALADNVGAWLGQVEERPGAAWPSEWLAAFARQLSALGFGRGRSLDSVEYQCLQRWHALLESLSGLDAVIARPIDRSVMLKLLKERCDATVFREQDTGVLVDILGVEEAIGTSYSSAWLMSLDAETWPGLANRDPLIPGEVQSSVPSATQAGTLELARQKLRLLCSLAPQVQGSYCPESDDIAREVSALVGVEGADDPAAWSVQPPWPLPEPAPVEFLANETQAPVLMASAQNPVHSGGTGVLRDMAQCPFRAFAVRRLGAKDLRPAKPGLSPLHRGNAVHKALETFWRDVRTHENLCALAEDELASVIAAAAQQAIADANRRYRLSIAGWDVTAETERLSHLLEHWLQVDRDRAPFTVVGFEQEVELAVGPLRFKGSVDRIDRLQGGSFLVIDYKSSAPPTGDWLSPLADEEHRFPEPQLPAYVLNLAEAPTAIAFAQVQPQEVKFDGVSAEKIDVPGVQTVEKKRYRYAGIEDWDALTHLWRRGLLQLSENYVAGDAVVDPLRNACDHCHLQAVCRINERRGETFGDVESDDNDWQGFGDE